jgi:4-hydroxyphenylpyruvate dioxygenase-like putative hemolysin
VWGREKRCHLPKGKGKTALGSSDAFFEIICRRGSLAFGKGNFETLELEREKRGNL